MIQESCPLPSADSGVVPVINGRGQALYMTGDEPLGDSPLIERHKTDARPSIRWAGVQHIAASAGAFAAARRWDSCIIFLKTVYLM